MAKKKRPVKAVITKHRAGYRVTLKSSNGNILFHGKGWNTKASAKKAIKAITDSPLEIVDEA